MSCQLQSVPSQQWCTWKCRDLQGKTFWILQILPYFILASVRGFKTTFSSRTQSFVRKAACGGDVDADTGASSAGEVGVKPG